MFTVKKLRAAAKEKTYRRKQLEDGMKLAAAAAELEEEKKGKKIRRREGRGCQDTSCLTVFISLFRRPAIRHCKYPNYTCTSCPFVTAAPSLLLTTPSPLPLSNPEPSNDTKLVVVLQASQDSF